MQEAIKAMLPFRDQPLQQAYWKICWYPYITLDTQARLQCRVVDRQWLCAGCCRVGVECEAEIRASHGGHGLCHAPRQIGRVGGRLERAAHEVARGAGSGCRPPRIDALPPSGCRYNTALHYAMLESAKMIKQKRWPRIQRSRSVLFSHS